MISRSIAIIFTLATVSNAFADDETARSFDFSFSEQPADYGKRWEFDGHNLPPLHLDNADLFVKDINQALSALGLPPVSQSVMEKEKITGFRGDRQMFEWQDYPEGVLTIRRWLCDGEWPSNSMFGSLLTDHERYDCISTVYLRPRR